MVKIHDIGRLDDVTMLSTPRLIGNTPVMNSHDRVDEQSTNFDMTSNKDFISRPVSVYSTNSEYSAANSWNMNYNTSNPGNQNNNNKTNNNRVRSFRRTIETCDVTIEELFTAYYDCRKHKRNTYNALKFESNLERNLMNLYDDLHNNNYTIGRSLCFVVLHPKPREIWAAEFRDRIIHHLIYNRISENFYKRFIYDSCACIPNKGTLFAINRLEHHIRSASENYTKPTYFLQMDISNFFVSINKNILFNLLKKYIDSTYTLELTRLVLFNDPTENVFIKSSKELLNKIPPYKSLFNSGGKGLPIGNLTSQFFANVYLNPLDQYIKRILKIKHYVRYVDDIILVNNDKTILYDISNKIREFTKNNLNILFHPNKTHIQDINKGINFVGYITKPFVRYIRNRTIINAKRIIKENPINLFESINSYLGILKHSNSFLKRQYLLFLYNKYNNKHIRSTF